MEIKDLKFDDKGLIPCIVQDADNDKVLMLAYMNEESVGITMEEKRTCFWSRSRGKLWRKGETSGNTQHLCSLTADCNGDAMLAVEKKDGPACHTGTESCFFNTLSGETGEEHFTLDDLYGLLLGRKQEMPEGSYTTYLFAKGREKILKKVGEEATEVIIGAMKDSKEEMIYEIADLTYHVMVLMAEAGITPEDIRKELGSRHIIDKKVKQETMR